MTRTQDTLTDRKLVRELNRGDKAAFLSVYDALAPGIHRFVFFKTGQDTDLADDITQDTFVKMWDYIVSRCKPIDNVRAFAYRTARNRVIDHWRKRGRHPTVSFDEEIAEPDDDTGTWCDEFNQKLDRDLILYGLERIPTQYREVLVLRYIEELDVKTISAIVEKKPSTVYVLVQRALKRMRQELEHHT